MAGLFEIGKSGLNSYREALSVTGQNIANINTDGYKRREASLKEVSGATGGITEISSQLGLGVRVDEIRRSFDEFLLNKARNDTSYASNAESYLENISQLENVLLPGEANLGNAIGLLFESFQEVASNPSDTSPRIMVLHNANYLSDLFHQTNKLTEELIDGLNSQSELAVSELNYLVDNLANVNRNIISSGAKTQNALLDNRDAILDKMSEYIGITVELETNNTATVSLGKSGNGPKLVDGVNASQLRVDRGIQGLNFFISKSGTEALTSQVTDGKLNGLKESFYSMSNTLKTLDEIAFKIVQDVNKIHQNGIDLEGQKGKKFFHSLSFEAIPNESNLGDATAFVEVTDRSLVGTDEITFNYSEENNLWTARDTNGNQIANGRDQVNLPGLNIEFSGTAYKNDTIIISPVKGASAAIGVSIERPEEIAAALPFKVSAGLSNASDTTMKVMEVDTHQEYENPPEIHKIMSDGHSYLAATNFIRDGAVATIPANVSEIELFSLKQQSSVNFSVADTAISGIQNVNLSIVSGNNAAKNFSFALAEYAENVNTNSSDSSFDWSDAEEIARLMNVGALTATNTVDRIPPTASSSSIEITGSLIDNDDRFSVTLVDEEGNQTTLTHIASDVNENSSTIATGLATVSENQSIYSISSTDGVLSISRSDGVNFAVNAGVSVNNDGVELDNAASSQAVNQTSNGDQGGEPVSFSLKELGGYASGKNGVLSISLSEDEVTSGTIIFDNFPNATGVIKERIDTSSNIQVFTREGRHIAGTAFSGLSDLINEENGFNPEAEYKGEYLNLTAAEGYMGISVDIDTDFSSNLILVEDTENGHLITFERISAIDNSDTSIDGSKASAAAFNYEIQIDDFSVSLDESNVDGDTPSGIAQAAIKELRSLAPIPSLSGLDNVITSESITLSNDQKALLDSAGFLTVTYGEVDFYLSYDGNDYSISGGRSDKISLTFNSTTNTISTTYPEFPNSDISLAIKFEGQVYNLVMKNGEIEVTGGEPNRILASFDSNYVLQISANGGSISKSEIEILADTEISGNTAAALSFGLITNSAVPTTSFANSDGYTPPNFDISIDGHQLILEKTLDGANDHISITQSATTHIGERIKLSDLPSEELVILITNSSGNTTARSLSASYQISSEAILNESRDLTVKVVDELIGAVEIFDTETGTSIASRTLDENGKTSAAGFEFELSGKLINEDTFTILNNNTGVYDNRNIQKLIDLRLTNSNGDGGFQEIFSTLILDIGADIQANSLNVEASQALRDASVEAEAMYSGVNLDTEASNLIEYQQAYQASARILQTAREIFQTLLDMI